MQIGMFTREASGFTGQIHTLTLACDLAIIPAEPSETENAPDYRVVAGNGLQKSYVINKELP